MFAPADILFQLLTNNELITINLTKKRVLYAYMIRVLFIYHESKNFYFQGI